MNGDAFALGAAALVGAAAGLAAYEALVRFATGGAFATAGSEPDREEARASKPPSRSRVRSRLEHALEACARLFEGFAPTTRVDADAWRDRLRRAGVAVAPETWRAVRVLSTVGCMIIAWMLLASLSSLPLSTIVGLSVVAGVGGWELPALDLVRRERRRKGAIEAHLPDAMELLGIAIAAGSPVEQCFKEVASSVKGPLSEELALVDQEVNLLGHTREQAFENLARRCRSQDVTAFAAQLTQAINQGSSIAKGLACQAALARETAQADALERIRKMPTKLDIVLSLCFLPPTVGLVVVPTVVNLLNFLNDSMT